ncbi:MAG: phosphatidylserine decarboxylase [Thermoplasmata archaeon]
MSNNHNLNAVVGTRFFMYALVAVILIMSFFLKNVYIVIFSALPLFFIYFLRDPERKIAGGIVSPADGRVDIIKHYDDGVFVSIFMNVYDVHINRSPVDGTIVSIQRMHGIHKPAYGDIEKNEKVKYGISTPYSMVDVEEIVGIFARRIIPFVKEGHINKGDKIGIIMFGSRVNVYIHSKNVVVEVKKGQKVKAASTSIARWIDEH